MLEAEATSVVNSDLFCHVGAYGALLHVVGVMLLRIMGYKNSTWAAVCSDLLGEQAQYNVMNLSAVKRPECCETLWIKQCFISMEVLEKQRSSGKNVIYKMAQDVT